MEGNEIGKIQDLARLLGQSRSTVILTGSGISAESGIPTFREAQTGLWSRYDPQELASPDAFRRHPGLVWEWYSWRRDLVSKARPNPGHIALSRLQQRIPNLLLVTQNIDGLHQLAGSRDVIELHGNIKRTKCSKEGRIVPEKLLTGEIPPRCPYCNGLLRPDVIWFGESLPVPALSAAVRATQSCDLFISIGTSALVQPAASLALDAKRNGASIAELNLDSTPLTPLADIVLHGKAGQLLPALLDTVFPH